MVPNRDDRLTLKHRPWSDSSNLFTMLKFQSKRMVKESTLDAFEKIYYELKPYVTLSLAVFGLAFDHSSLILRLLSLGLLIISIYLI